MSAPAVRFYLTRNLYAGQNKVSAGGFLPVPAGPGLGPRRALPHAQLGPLQSRRLAPGRLVSPDKLRK